MNATTTYHTPVLLSESVDLLAIDPDGTYVDLTFGGGGHVRAAGCMLFGDLEDVVDRLSYAVSQYLED